MRPRTARLITLALPVAAVLLLGGCATTSPGPSKYAPHAGEPGYVAPAYPYYYYPYYNPAPVIDSFTVNPAIVK